jgi:hypothetical protein
MAMDELPSRRFSKPVLGRVSVRGTRRRAPRRYDYIDVARGRDGQLMYVLNVWRRPNIPRVVSEAEVEAVEPFDRPAC